MSFFRSGSEEQSERSFDLWLSWSGGTGNVWLVQPGENTILEALWPSQTVVPGQRFAPPTPPTLLSWRELTFPDYLREREAAPSMPLNDFACKRLWGIDEAIAEVIEREVQASSPSSNLQWSEFEAVMKVIRAATNTTTPVALITGTDGTGRIVPVPAEGVTPQFSSLAAALAALDGMANAASDREIRLAPLKAKIARTMGQLQHRLNEADHALADGGRSDKMKRHADLLGSQRDLIRRGMSTVTLEDWENGEDVTLSLDPALSPQENIDALYRLARKKARATANASKSRPDLVRRLGECEDRLRLLNKPDLADEALDEIESAVGSPSGDRGRRPDLQPRRLPYREFSVGNETILVGRSSRDNDELTLHIAKPDDLFFHASQSGGAHVILRRGPKGRIVSHEAIVATAQIAAFFSKARHSTLVPVVYSEARHVRKPRKAPAGLVSVTHEKSVMVRPIQPQGYRPGDEKN